MLIVSHEVFLGSVEWGALFVFRRSCSRLEVNGTVDLPAMPLYLLQPQQPICGLPILLRHPLFNDYQ
jgi:hypothetical protein